MEKEEELQDGQTLTIIVIQPRGDDGSDDEVVTEPYRKIQKVKLEDGQTSEKRTPTIREELRMMFRRLTDRLIGRFALFIEACCLCKLVI